MSNDEIRDLKAYIASTVSTIVFEIVNDAVSQSETRLTNRIDKLDEKMMNGFSGVADAIEQINHRLDKAHLVI